jgi:AcrR family transcriptional regulator
MPPAAPQGTAMATRAEGAEARPALSRERVARAALAYLDSHGLDGLSMRRLAGELGVGTMTLYHYFPSKRELLDAVVEIAFADEKLPPLEGSWRDRLRSLSRAGRAALSRHPSLVAIRARQPILQADALRFSELGLGILEEAGFEREEAVKAFRLLFTYTLGFAILSPETAEKEARGSARAALAALPPEYYPRLSEAVDEAAEAMAGDAVFDYGLERILDGLEARRAGPATR